MKKELTIRQAFQFYEQELLPKIEKIAVQQKDGYHGLYTHTDSVVFRAIDYAVALHKNPFPVIFAAACHDMARTIDSYDDIHGKNAVPMAQKIMSGYQNKLSPQEQKSICYAIENHTLGEKAPDFIAACLWDADRTRLSWERGYNEIFFQTDYSKQVAQNKPEQYLTYQNQILGRPEKTDREGVLETSSFEVFMEKIRQSLAKQ